MTLRTLLFRSLRFHWRAHLGVVLGAAIGSAALIGALVVGDSVRGSLRDKALERLGHIRFVLHGGDRLFTDSLGDRMPRDLMDNWSESSTGEALDLCVWFAGGPGTALMVPGMATRPGGDARANGVTVIGTAQLPPHERHNHYYDFWSWAGWYDAPLIEPGQVWLNENLARQLNVAVGDTVLLRLHKPSALSQDTPISPRADNSTSLRLRVARVVKPEQLGNFALRTTPLPPLNAFVNLFELQRTLQLQGRANLLVTGSVVEERDGGALELAKDKIEAVGGEPGKRLASVLPSRQSQWRDPVQAQQDYQEELGLHARLADYEASLRPTTGGRVELVSRRIFLDPPLVRAALDPGTNTARISPKARGSDDTVPATLPAEFSPTTAAPLLTYLVNLLRAGTNATPYSMVTAAGAPWTPADLRDDEILVSQWLAEDLHVKPGDTLEMVYFLPESGAALTEATNRFLVRAVVPPEMPWADRTLMPEFPGIEKAESTSDWDTAFPLVHKIRPKDEAYWKQHRGTPKAFITLAAGQRMWGNRFGNLTAIRFAAAADTTQTGKDSLSPAGGESRGEISTTDSRLEPSNRRGEAFGVPASAGAPDAQQRSPGRLKPELQMEVRGEGAIHAAAASPESGEGRARLEKLRAALETKLLASLKPEELGLRFEPVREQALRAAAQSQDFGGLFLGFSFFLIAAALLLMALLFQFGVEQRVTEVGTLLALGFTPGRVRRLWLAEGAVLAFGGGVVGALGGLGYARLMLHGLSTVWRDATGATTLRFHVSATTLVIGILASTLTASVVIWLAVRKLARRPARELLAGEVRGPKSEVRSRAPWIAGAALAGALGLVGWTLVKGDLANAGAFFGAGALVLVAGLCGLSGWLARQSKAEASAACPSPDEAGVDRRDASPTLAALALRGLARRRNRSVATAALLACGSFLVASIGVFRLDANRDAARPNSGTGGFALIGEATLPVVQDLNAEAGHEAFGLAEKDLAGVRTVSFRVREGDEASCLNLNRAQRPRLLAVKPEALEGRFTFVKGSGWQALRADVGQASRLSPSSPVKQNSETGATPVLPEIPAIGDAASIQWAMGKQVGDALDFVDERGQAFKVRIVGAVANSILQGSLVIDEAAFVRQFPGESGYRFFLFDAPTNRATEISATLSRALEDHGLELTPAVRRLAQFNAVQNTYLGTFQVLGGLGLLLGSAGLGIVVLRNVLERRGELAVLTAVGFRRPVLGRMVLVEHGALLAFGLVIGVLAAAVAVLPAMLTPGAPLPWLSLGLTLLGVLLNGVLWTWLATRAALRGELLAALRSE